MFDLITIINSEFVHCAFFIWVVFMLHLTAQLLDCKRVCYHVYYDPFWCLAWKVRGQASLCPSLKLVLTNVNMHGILATSIHWRVSFHSWYLITCTKQQHLYGSSQFQRINAYQAVLVVTILYHSACHFYREPCACGRIVGNVTVHYVYHCLVGCSIKHASSLQLFIIFPYLSTLYRHTCIESLNVPWVALNVVCVSWESQVIHSWLWCKWVPSVIEYPIKCSTIFWQKPVLVSLISFYWV